MDQELLDKLRTSCREACDDLIRNYNVAQSQIDSFNQFITEGLPGIINNLQIVSALRDGKRFTLQVFNPKLYSPRLVEGGSDIPTMLLPSKCRERNLTYAAALHVDVVIKEYDWPEAEVLARRRPIDGTVRYSTPELYADVHAAERAKYIATACPHAHDSPDVLNAQDPGRLVFMRTDRDVFLASIPIATRSTLCHLEHGHMDAKTRSELGGIFIIDGMNKIMPPMARLAHNEMFVFKDPKHLAHLEVRCSPYARRFCATATLSMVLTRAPTSGASMSQDVLVTLPFVGKAVPVAVLVRALGWDLVSFACLVGTMMGGTEIPELDFKLRTLFAELPSNFTQDMALAALATCSSANARHVGATMRSSAGEVPTGEASSEQSAPLQPCSDATLSLIRFGQHTLRHSLFPHLAWNAHKKVFLLARCVWKLLACTSEPPIVPFDDRDLHKRYETCGPLWTSLLRQVLTSYLDTVGRQLSKTLSGNRHAPIVKLIDGIFPSNQFAYCMKTGTWCATKSALGRRNVVQSLANASEAALVAHFTRLSTSVNSEARDTGPRQVRGLAFLRQCPSHTPEDRFCGLTTHVAFGTRMSLGLDPALLARILMRSASDLIIPFDNWQEEFLNVFDGTVHFEDLTSLAKRFAAAFSGKTAVFIETDMVGWTCDPQALALRIRTLRRQFAIAPDVGVTVKAHPENTLCLRTCAGRIMAPLVRVDSTTHAFWARAKSVTIAELEAEGILEYLDPDEMENCVTAKSVKHAVERLRQSAKRPAEAPWEFTHMMIDPALIFSCSAARIPYANHDAATRVSYSASMIGQGIDLRLDQNTMQANKHWLMYPQRQVVRSRFSEAVGGSLERCGQLLKVGVCDLGPNQNDAFVVCRQAIERGALTSVAEKLYRAEMEASQSQRQAFQRPEANGTTAQLKFGRSDHLDKATGLPHVGSIVRTGDVVIGKVEQMKPGSAVSQVRVGENLLDSSTCHHGEPAVVGRTMMTRGQKGVKIAKTVVYSIKEMLEGDKISSVHGQKGVARIMDAWDMPFSVIDGTTLDVAIGAPGSCSRHTDGQTHESNANKAFCLNPTTMTLEQLHDATAFADRDPAKIQQILHKGGFSKTGTERFCSGTTGEMIDVAIFVGMVYMQKLKHMVSDKHHACMVAPRNPVTQQPCSGRFNGGALKTGTMELDALVAHGAEDLVSEFLRTESDPAWMWCCTKCGSITTVMVGNTFCVMCGGKNTGKPMPTVGFFKVLVNELACLNIRCTLPLKRIEVLDKFHQQRTRARKLNARLETRCAA